MLVDYGYAQSLISWLLSFKKLVTWNTFVDLDLHFSKCLTIWEGQKSRMYDTVNFLFFSPEKKIKFLFCNFLVILKCQQFCQNQISNCVQAHHTKLDKPTATMPAKRLIHWRAEVEVVPHYFVFVSKLSKRSGSTAKSLNIHDFWLGCHHRKDRYVLPCLKCWKNLTWASFHLSS